jgi:pyridoxine 5-phosphate synthase
MRLALQTRMNLEIAATAEMQAFALGVRPADVCLVPERREEVTTEGGLDVASQARRLRDYIAPLKAAGIRVSLFIDPDLAQIEAVALIGAPAVELHTGAYAETSGEAQAAELHRLRAAAREAAARGLIVNAGHGLTHHNVQPVAAIREIVELNIGHAIIARAVFTGLAESVREMKRLMLAARQDPEWGRA